MTGFDRQVKEIRKRGVEPKHYHVTKSEATPEQWAANLEYFKQRYRKNAKSQIERTTKWQRNNKSRCRGLHLWRSYKITADQYAGMHAGQDGGCAICGCEDSRGHRLSVDHSHADGFVRGLLCNTCNTAIGAMGDSPDLLRKAADYLEAGGTQAFCLKTFYQRATETTNERN